MAAADRSEGVSKSGKQYLTEERPLLNPDSEELGTNDKQLNSVFDSVGYGAFHVFITLVCGMALASDSIEVLCVSFVIPVAEGELRLGDIDKATLDSVIFVGMMIGGLFWGSWADAVGRRTCLVNSLLVNGISGLLSGLMPNFGGFLFFRLLSGIGVGGSLPVVFSYFSEFFSSKKKGPVVIVLASFWMVGQVYTALLAWGLLSNPCLVNTHIGSMPFRSWRVFAMLCTLPAITAALLFIILPESPSWLYRSGKWKKAEKALQYVARVNYFFTFCCKKGNFSSETLYLESETVTDSSPNHSDDGTSVPYHDDEIAGPKKSAKICLKVKKICSGLWEKFMAVLKAIYHLFTRVYLRTTVVMLVVQVSLSFGYYGLQIWFPEYFKHLLQNTTANSTSVGCSVVGENCTQLDSTCSKVYRDSLLETAATVPGTVLGILTINLIGGRIQITFAMLFAGVSVLLIWWLPASEITVVALSCFFSGFTIIGWNALDVIEVEYFGTEVRSTALGVLNSAARIAIIASNFTFGAFQNVDPSIPILMAAVTLITGGVSPLFLPLSSDPDRQSLLGKHFRRWMNLMWSKIKKKSQHAH